MTPENIFIIFPLSITPLASATVQSTHVVNSPGCAFSTLNAPTTFLGN